MNICVCQSSHGGTVKSMNECSGSIFQLFIWSTHSGHVVFVSAQKQLIISGGNLKLAERGSGSETVSG